jgi:hypothetical protein
MRHTGTRTAQDMRHALRAALGLAGLAGISLLRLVAS